MSNLPKEQQTAYQRWEMTSFGDERPSVVAARRPPPEPAALAPELAAPALQAPTEAELAALREQARSEGYAAGQASGHAEGHAAGHAAALAEGRAAAADQLGHLASIATEFSTALTQADDLISAEVLELALQLAKGMLKTALKVKPELVLPVVREAVEYLPVLQQPAVLMLHPDDIGLVRDGIGDELDKGGWRVVEDGSVSRGGCKVDTASNQIDASVEARWQRLSQALGKNVDWLAP